MEKKYSEKYDVYLNANNFEEREEVLNVCKYYVERFVGSSYGSKKETIKCVDIVNNLSDDFPFETITFPFLKVMRQISPSKYNVREHLEYCLPFLYRIRYPKDYRDLVDILLHLPLDLFDEVKAHDIGFSDRFENLFHNCKKMSLNICCVFNGDMFRTAVYRYVAASMYVEAYLNGEENLDYIKDEINNLMKTFDVKEFAMVRGLQSLAKTGTYKENVIYHDCEGFSIEYKGTGGLDDIYEYIYQFIKEKRNEDNQLIK